MRLPFSRRSALGLALAAGALAAPLRGQAADEMGRLTWNIGPATAGWCVHFLMEPKEAVKELTPDLRVVAASTTDNIHPALKRAISDEPKYADWVPSELCTWFVESITAEGKKYERGKKNAPLAIMFWGVAATEGEAAWDGQFWLRSVGSNSYPLVRAMQVQKLPADEVMLDLKPIKGNEEDQLFYTKWNGAIVQLSGHFNPDTTGAPVRERKLTGVMPGPIDTKWTTTVTYTPEKNGTMAGSLQVFGKRRLAKALNSSPIRLIGPAFTGGSGTAVYVRTSTKKR